MKKHILELTEKQNKRLKQIRDYLRLNNMIETVDYLIKNFDDGFEKYLKEKGEK